MIKYIRSLFLKPFYFPREDFKIFTKYELPEEFDHLGKATCNFGSTSIENTKKPGIFEMSFDNNGVMRDDPRVGDIWLTTGKETNKLRPYVFLKIKVTCDKPGCYVIMDTLIQNFGLAGDLLQIEKMKELVIGGGKMKPVVLEGKQK